MPGTTQQAENIPASANSNNQQRLNTPLVQEDPATFNTQSQVTEETSSIFDENESEEETENPINIIRQEKEPITVSFSEKGNCFLHKNNGKKHVPLLVEESNFFNKFVKGNCPKVGKLNIVIDENNEIIEIYSFDKNNKKINVLFNTKEREKFKPIIDKIVDLNNRLNPIEKNPVNSITPPQTTNQPFPATAVNSSETPSPLPPPINPNNHSM